jgi:YgiT-type zinc finger domain-containing protein
MSGHDDVCAFCGAEGLEPTTTTLSRNWGGVEVIVNGVPATHCPTCDVTGVHGKVGIPIDEAMLAIHVATGVAAPPDPKEDERLRAEMRELARSLGQEDLIEASGQRSD